MPVRKASKKKSSVSRVKEPPAAYAAAAVKMLAVKTGILDKTMNKPESHLTAVEKMDIVRNGITKNSLEQLKTKTKLDYDKLSKIFSVSRATLINKNSEEKFNLNLSEKIMSLADIYSYGYDVFEEVEKFNQWMLRENKALNGQAPLELIDNQYGREEVKDLIGRIDYGVYS